MTEIIFNFMPDGSNSQQFTMGKACQPNLSVNPADASAACIYVINNTNGAGQTAYVGFAQDANDRWKTRTEAFHCFGISYAYAKNVKCAWCYP